MPQKTQAQISYNSTRAHFRQIISSANLANRSKYRTNTLDGNHFRNG